MKIDSALNLLAMVDMSEDEIFDKLWPLMKDIHQRDDLLESFERAIGDQYLFIRLGLKSQQYILDQAGVSTADKIVIKEGIKLGHQFLLCPCEYCAEKAITNLSAIGYSSVILRLSKSQSEKDREDGDRIELRFLIQQLLGTTNDETSNIIQV